MNIVTINNHLSDEELILNFQAGDDVALSTLIYRHKGIILRTCNSFYLDRWDKDDLFQEGMIAFFKAVRSYSTERQDKKNFKGYAKNIIHLHMIGVLRKHTRQKQQVLNRAVPLEADNSNIESNAFDVIKKQPDSEAPNPVDVVVDNEFIEEFNNYIKYNLSTLESETLCLYLDGYSYKQIAVALGVSNKAIDNAICRVKKKLKKGIFSKQTETQNTTYAP